MGIEEALNEAMQRPEDYFGEIIDLQEQGWARVWGRTRDSDNREIVNYEFVLEYLNKNYKQGKDFTVSSSSHWAVGWTDEILVRALECDCEDEPDFTFGTVALDNETTAKRWHCRSCGEEAEITEVFDVMYRFAMDVQDYPVLDEDALSKMDHEELLEYIDDNISYCTPDDIEDFEIDNDEVARYLFDVHSVSHIDDLDSNWITEAITAQYEEWWDDYAANYNKVPGQTSLEDEQNE